MRAIPILLMLVGLLLGGPALAQSGRGLVDHMTTATLPTCDTGLTGYRVYDTTLGYEVTCNGTAYIASGGTGTYSDITIEGTTPSLNFEDTNETTSAIEGSIDVNCPTEGDCDMDFTVEANGVTETLIRLDGVAANNADLYLGNVTDGLNMMISELGNVYVYAQTPYIYWHDVSDDSGDAGSEAQIGVYCPTTDDCDMVFIVESGGVNKIPIHIDTTDGAGTSVQIGDGGSTDYMNINEDGVLSMVGASRIIFPTGAAPPATCTPGEIFIDTDETNDDYCTTTADNSICACVAVDTWASTE